MQNFDVTLDDGAYSARAGYPDLDAAKRATIETLGRMAAEEFGRGTILSASIRCVETGATCRLAMTVEDSTDSFD